MSRRRDDGRITVFFAIMAPAWFALMGLVVVGGNRIIALQRADNIAAEAARAAGQAINAPEAIVGGAKIVDPAAAAAAAEAYILAAGARPVSLLIAEDRQHLAITVQVTYSPGAFGFFAGSWTAQGKATATLVVS
jgi:Flp pilus assembly protein TadG